MDTTFVGYGLAVIEKATDVCVREVLNGEYSLSFALPANDSKWGYITEENFVKVKDQLFVIRNISDAHGDDLLRTVTCEHVFFLLLDDYIESVALIGNAPAMMSMILAGTAHTIGTVDVTGTIDEETLLEDQNPIKAINALIGTLGGELRPDNFEVNLLTHRGSTTPNIQFRYRKNIKSINRTSDSSSLITRLYVYGNDGLTIEDATNGDGKKYLDSQYISNYRRPKTGSVSFDTDDADELYEMGLKYLATAEIPAVSYEVYVVELKSLAEYGALEEFTLGDEGMVIDEVLGINVQARIIEYEWYPLEPPRSVVKLANFKPGVETQLSQLRDMKDQLTTTDGSVKVSTAWFEGAINTLQNQLIASGSYATAQVIEGKGLLFENTNEASPDYGAVYVGPGILAIANEKTGSPLTWNWRTFGTGDGFTGDLLLGNTVKATSLVVDQALIDLLNAQNIIAGAVKAENIDVTTAKITSAQIGSVKAAQIDVTDAKIGTAQIEALTVGTNVTMGENASISWAKVTNQPSIPDGTHIDENGVYTGTVVTDQIDTTGLTAEEIYDPANSSNVMHFQSAAGGFELQVRGTGVNNFFSIIGYDTGEVDFAYGDEVFLTKDFNGAIAINGLHAQWG